MTQLVASAIDARFQRDGHDRDSCDEDGDLEVQEQEIGPLVMGAQHFQFSGRCMNETRVVEQFGMSESGLLFWNESYCHRSLRRRWLHCCVPFFSKCFSGNWDRRVPMRNMFPLNVLTICLAQVRVSRRRSEDDPEPFPLNARFFSKIVFY